jgi:hypothetical protein
MRSEAALTLWHYLGAFLLGSVVTVLGAARCAMRRRWVWATMGLVPFVAGAAWIRLVWVRSDWESSFFDQAVWVLFTEGALLLAVWMAGMAAWLACVHSVRRSLPGGNHD